MYSLPTLPCLPCLLLLSFLSLPTTSALSEYADYSNDAGVYEYEYPEDDKSEEKVIEYTLAKVVIHSSKLHIMVEKNQLIRLPCLMENPDNIQVIWSHIPPSGKGKAQIAIGEKMLSEGRTTVEVDSTGSTLLIPQAEESDSGEYVCEVATGAGSVPSLVHTVTVREQGEGQGTVGEEQRVEMSSLTGGSSCSRVSCSLVLLVVAGMGLVLV